MAQKISVLLLDDLDGVSEAVDTITFGLDGSHYEIDLSVEHADEFRDALAPYIAAARKGQAPSLRARNGKAPRPSNSQAGAIRTWAREQGITVPERGRLPLDVMERYNAAHPTSGQPEPEPQPEPQPEPENGEVQADSAETPEPVEVVDVTDPEPVVDKPKRSRSKKSDAGTESVSTLLP